MRVARMTLRTPAGTEVDLALGALTSIRVMQRARSGGRSWAAELRSILAAGPGAPRLTRAGEALVYSFPAGPTRSLDDYRAVGRSQAGDRDVDSHKTRDYLPFGLGSG